MTGLTRDQFALLTDVARAMQAAGGRALLVGGCVRDALLHLPLKDIDVEVFGIEPERLRGLLESFGQVDCVGAAFGVYKVAGLDVSIPRRDSKAGHGHKGFVIQGDPSMSITDAARRRDFTMNAVSFDPLTGIFIDPTGYGMDDIQSRTLRVVDPLRFGDDSLRVLRAMQFIARFDLMLDMPTAVCMAAIPLHDLPAERVWGEFDKLLRSPSPSLGLDFAQKVGIVEKLWPELDALIGVQQDPGWHPEGDVWTHTLQVIDAARALLDDTAQVETRALDTTVMLAALCHDFGKPATTAFLDGRWRAHGHEAAGVEPTRTFLERLNVQSIDGYDVRGQVLALVEHHLLPLEWFRDPPRSSAFRRLSRKCDLLLLARVAEADISGRFPKVVDTAPIEWFIDRVRTLDLKPGGPEPILLGRHLIQLGLTPGPSFTPILKAVFDLQLDGTVTTLNEAMAAAARIIARS
jgi:tRNA nucleotidyltransferase (CCA-adding enzyme)